MPTGFDNFTDSAHHDFMNLSEEVLMNRKLLKQAMEKYAVLDLSFKQLKQADNWFSFFVPGD